MALEGKDAEFAGSWLAQLKSAVETTVDPVLKELASKASEALNALLGDAAPVALATAAEAVATTDAAVAVAASVRKLTGKDAAEEVAATISAWKSGAESSPDASTVAELIQEVASFNVYKTDREIRDVLAANRSKCTPAMEKHFLRRNAKGQLCETVESVKATLDVIEARPVTSAALPAVGAGTPTGGAPEEVTLTDADREVCAALGRSEETFLAHKKAQIQASRAAGRK